MNLESLYFVTSLESSKLTVENENHLLEYSTIKLRKTKVYRSQVFRFASLISPGIVVDDFLIRIIVRYFV